MSPTFAFLFLIPDLFRIVDEGEDCVCPKVSVKQKAEAERKSSRTPFEATQRLRVSVLSRGFEAVSIRSWSYVWIALPGLPLVVL